MILDFQILNSQPTLIPRSTNYVPLCEHIFILLIIILPEKSRSKIVNFSNTPFGTSKKDNMNIGRLLRTKLINTKQPPTDKYCPFQLWSFFSVHSSIISQTLLFNLRKCIGIPRYLNRNDHFLHPNSYSYCGSKSLAFPKQKISLL
jgi:hypothetical protein